mmetsp:Transcript_153520/g.265708  ORF Transcript_153520/g.265708 Transcript_153520/m.265708 type:complete len:96 (-) Transcript_153520:385-672(-)
MNRFWSALPLASDNAALRRLTRLWIALAMLKPPDISVTPSTRLQLGTVFRSFTTLIDVEVVPLRIGFTQRPSHMLTVWVAGQLLAVLVDIAYLAT